MEGNVRYKFFYFFEVVLRIFVEEVYGDIEGGVILVFKIVKVGKSMIGFFCDVEEINCVDMGG